MRSTNDSNPACFGHCLAPAAALALCLAALPARASDDAARFDTPESAVKALLDATRTREPGGMTKIFGSAVKELLSGDEVQDKADFEGFARRLGETNSLARNEDGSMTLHVGRNGYPFPIPLVKRDGKWYFDTDAGKEEILNRRIGENELNTIKVCRGYVEAQREYAGEDRDGDEVLEYAQRIASTTGKKDGLFWETAENEPLSPLGPLVAQARTEGYGRKEGSPPPPPDAKPQPYHGYIYRILTAQGGKSPGGRFDYVINGNMVAGFALVAYPVDYGNAGIMTFLVNSNGVVYQKDLGEDTNRAAEALNTYDRDETWTAVKD